MSGQTIFRLNCAIITVNRKLCQVNKVNTQEKVQIADLKSTPLKLEVPFKIPYVLHML